MMLLHEVLYPGFPNIRIYLVTLSNGKKKRITKSVQNEERTQKFKSHSICPTEQLSSIEQHVKVKGSSDVQLATVKTATVTASKVII